jgi:hypothetical protein
MLQKIVKVKIMEKGIVSKMGEQLVVGVTGKGFVHGDKVKLKPKGVNVILYQKVSSQGDRQIVIIPKDYHQFFKRENSVFITKQKPPTPTE